MTAGGKLADAGSKNCIRFSFYRGNFCGCGLCQRSETGPLRSRPHHIRFLLAEVALQQAFERLAVAGFVAGHFMHGVMDGVEVERLGERPS